MVEFNLTTVIVPYPRDIVLYTDMQIWAMDHCPSFAECNVQFNDLKRIDWYIEFEFRDQGEAAWFKLKWAV